MTRRLEIALLQFLLQRVLGLLLVVGIGIFLGWMGWVIWSGWRLRGPLRSEEVGGAGGGAPLVLQRGRLEALS